MPEKWEDIAALKRNLLLASIPPDWFLPDAIKPPDSQLNVTRFPAESRFFTSRELELTSLGAASLLEKLASGAWSAVEVAEAYCKRAAVAHQLTNCLSETLFDTARSTAAALDEHLRTTGRPKGPLHGLPISLKDNFNIMGVDSTVGFVSWVNQPATYDSTLVQLLRNAGAVFYVKTNVPTAMMIAETVNNVFGRTLNPLNRALTSGGSSGGESALIAFGGSALGVGTDIGGSLRIPAACTGIFTLRPSFGRFPTLGAKSGLAGQEAVQSVNGPMARSLEDLVLFSKTVVEARPWLADPRCLPIPWREVSLGRKLKLAVMWHDGVVMPTPPVRRALRETVEQLQAAGHEVVEWRAEGHERIAEILGRFFVADGGKTVKSILDPVGEPWRPEMAYYKAASEMGVAELWKLQAERTELCKAYLDRWNGVAGLDGILCPTTPYASVAHQDFKYVGYTGVFNVLDYTALSFPSGVTAHRELDRAAAEAHAPLSDVCAEISGSYNEEAVHDMPVNLQLVGRRLEEEKVLQMADIILKDLGMHAPSRT
ncbi:amidase [Trichodelitschia bisporula]|uniref:amidase n=1 Tax=Trichodelitschia bisporula TaxID=703511 RepID=A0A6G1HXV4_9PEZI|nr:amidase [Trichodelitschia bisporula]